MLRSRFLWKLFAGSAALVLLVLAGVGKAFHARHAEAALGAAEEQLALIALTIAADFDARLATASDHVDWELSPPILERAAALELRVLVVDPRGNVVARFPANAAAFGGRSVFAPGSALERAAVQDGVATARSRGGAELGIDAMARVGGPGAPRALVRIHRPLGGGIVDDDTVGEVIVVAALIAALAFFALAWFQSRAVEAPLAELTRSARAMSKGDFERRVGALDGDSFGDLGRALNRVAATSRERMDEMTTDRQRVLAILGAMIEGVVAVDADCCVVHMNAAAARILGTQSANTGGRHISEVTRVREVREILERAIATGEGQNGEVCVVVPPRDRWAEMLASPLRDGEREIAGAVLVLHDVTELRRLEAIRRDFVANVSHELKTPIAAIRGMIETVLDDPSMDPDLRTRFLGRTRDQAFRLSSLVTDLLTLSRMEASSAIGERVPLDLRAPVRDSIAALMPTAESAEIHIETEIPDDEITVLGERESLRLVATNLLDNAIKYTPAGGRVWVRVERNGRHARLSVTDTGVGIERKHVDRIFQRFYRVDKARSRELGGTGLGLSIVKHVCLAHDGTVRVESTPGRGSVFQVELPLA